MGVMPRWIDMEWPKLLLMFENKTIILEINNTYWMILPLLKTGCFKTNQTHLDFDRNIKMLIMINNHWEYNVNN